MIPKIIHFIWFGGKEYPDKIKFCMESWKKYLPEYEFMLWNEDSFDINMTRFTREAYEHKKWAFVSDFVRVWALNKFGGIYLDTDIEVLRPFDDAILCHKVLLGTDRDGALTALMGSEPEQEIWQKVLDHYNAMTFVKEDGTLNTTVNNTYIQDILSQNGFVAENKRQSLSNGIEIYPNEYFHVVDALTGNEYRTKNSYAIHWHTYTWCSPRTHLMRYLRVKVFRPIFGGERAGRLFLGINRLKNIFR